MKSTSKKQEAPRLWYWGEPEGGMSVEDCERIAKEIPPFEREKRPRDLYIAFMWRQSPPGMKHEFKTRYEESWIIISIFAEN